MSEEKLPLLAFEKKPIVGENPFDGDCLKREALAKQLTGYIDRLSAGAVLAIDAPWGEGKTWFGRNWSEQLRLDGYKVAYVDAFEQDYVEDPFILLASELLTLVENETTSKQLGQKAVGVLQATMSIGTKVVSGLVTKHLLAGVNLGDEVEKAIATASTDATALTSKFLEENFKNYDKDKLTVATYKEELAKYAISQDKPLVVFIDELDRCMPAFAVNLIERIKHFFDVPNVVFVLLLNREQLEKAVQGVYGQGTDGVAYLGKFVNFFLQLPKAKASSYFSVQNMEKFVSTSFKKYEFPNTKDKVELIKLLTLFSVKFDLGLRDIEKAISMYAFTYPIQRLDQVLIYSIVLKQKDPYFFARIVKNDIQAHQEMVETLTKMIADDIDNGGSNQRTLSYFLEWHVACASGFKDLGKQFLKWHGFLAQESYDITYSQMFAYFADRIDLKIES